MTALVGLLVSGCRDDSGFACEKDEQCRRDDGAVGQCFAVGACGYADVACDSGWRYSEHAPEPWAGRCVVPEQDTAVDASDTGTGSTGEPTPDGSTTQGEPSGSSSDDGSSSGGISQECGDEIVQAGEQCDDGNFTESDGCNPDCRFSGSMVTSFESGLPQDERALDVMLLDGGDLVIAGNLSDRGEDRDAYVARYSPGGERSWSHVRGGSANVDDHALRLATGPEGHVRVVGYLTPSNSDMMTPRAQIWFAELDVATGEPRWDFTDGAAPPSNDQGRGVVSLPGGDLVVAGRIGANAESDIAVRRYTITERAGVFSRSTVWAQAFDGPASTSDIGYALALDAMGRLIVAGSVHETPDDIDRHLRAIDLEGQALRPPCIDAGGDDPLDADDRIFDVAVGPDGSVAAVGWATKDADEGRDAWLGFYAPGECTLQWATTVVGPAGEDDAATAVAIDDLGRIIVGGYLRVGNGDDAWLAKYEPDGTQWWAIEPIDGPANGTDRIEAVVIDAQREIVVAGRLDVPGQSDVWVARFTP